MNEARVHVQMKIMITVFTKLKDLNQLYCILKPYYIT